jgi:cell division protein ZapA (FtsZ GTPase activity inhibitor)
MAEEPAAAGGNTSGYVTVEIYDQVYHLSGQDAEHIRDLAARVDAKMRAVAAHGRTVDSLRVAVLAALNLADELTQDGVVGSAGLPLSIFRAHGRRGYRGEAEKTDCAGGGGGQSQASAGGGGLVSRWRKLAVGGRFPFWACWTKIRGIKRSTSRPSCTRLVISRRDPYYPQ